MSSSTTSYVRLLPSARAERKAAGGRPWNTTGVPLSVPASKDTALYGADLHVCHLGWSYGDHNARRVPRDHSERRQSGADGRRPGVGGTHLPGAEAAHRVEPADVHSPRDVHHRVLSRIQAHGGGPRARHHDPLRACHA